MRRIALLTTACVLTMAIGGCKHDGRTLRPAKRTQTGSVSTTTVARPGDSGGDGFDTVASSSTLLPIAGLSITAPWRNGAAIDPRYTCDGLNVAPALAWTAAPAGTVEIALTLTDVDTPDYVHWAIAGIAPTAVSISEATTPIGAFEATNGAGQIGYTGPCPPAGETHTYELTVHYLGESTELADGDPGLDLLDAISAVEIDFATVTGSFSRP